LASVELASPTAPNRLTCLPPVQFCSFGRLAFGQQLALRAASLVQAAHLQPSDHLRRQQTRDNVFDVQFQVVERAFLVQPLTRDQAFPARSVPPLALHRVPHHTEADPTLELSIWVFEKKFSFVTIQICCVIFHLLFRL
jgi:hypothetical protein